MRPEQLTNKIGCKVLLRGDVLSEPDADGKIMVHVDFRPVIVGVKVPCESIERIVERPIVVGSRVRRRVPGVVRKGSVLAIHESIAWVLWDATPFESSTPSGAYVSELVSE